MPLTFKIFQCADKNKLQQQGSFTQKLNGRLKSDSWLSLAGGFQELLGPQTVLSALPLGDHWRWQGRYTHEGSGRVRARRRDRDVGGRLAQGRPMPCPGSGRWLPALAVITKIQSAKSIENSWIQDCSTWKWIIRTKSELSTLCFHWEYSFPCNWNFVLSWAADSEAIWLTLPAAGVAGPLALPSKIFFTYYSFVIRQRAVTRNRSRINLQLELDSDQSWLHCQLELVAAISGIEMGNPTNYDWQTWNGRNNML